MHGVLRWWRSRYAPRWRTVAVTAALALGLVGPQTGCKNRGSRTGDLAAPDSAPAWENRFAVAFDDAYTRESINLVGRAPHDVLDQRLFAARLGHSALVARVSVDQVWGRGRHEGSQDQYLDVTIDHVFIGELPKNTNEQQLLPVASNGELSAELQGASMILFVRWAPGDKPAFHHHLMPSDPELEGYIEALVDHARSEGVLNASGQASGKTGKRKKKRSDKKDKKKAKRDAKSGGDAKASGDAKAGGGKAKAGGKAKVGGGAKAGAGSKDADK